MTDDGAVSIVGLGEQPESEMAGKEGRSGGGDILAIGFGTTVAMWAVGYVCRMPPAAVPSWLLLVMLLGCMAGGGFVAGRYTARGWRGGLRTGLLSAGLTMLILGSLLAGDRPNQVVPSALWWLPGALLVGATLGAFGAGVGSLFQVEGVEQRNWTTAFAWVACGATLLLVVAGGLVTGYQAGLSVVDWPNSFGYNMFLYPLSRMAGGVYYEHAHRLFGSLVGLTTMVLAFHLQRVEQRRWVARLGLAGLGLVVVQGILGGLRVTGRFTLSTSAEETAPNLELAITHGVVAQVFLGLLVSIAVFTSSAWRERSAAVRSPSASTDRSLSLLLVVALVVQLTLGALVRHRSSGLLVHISFAVVVALIGLTCGTRAWGLYTGEPIFRRIGKTLVVGIMGQLMLGIAALVVTSAGLELPLTVDAIVTTAHQAMGAVLLATAVMLMLWSRRLLEAEERRRLAGAPAATGG